MSQKIIGILGLGVFGSSIASTLAKFPCEVIAIDIKEENVERVEPFVSQAIVGDFTDIELLKAIDFDACDTVVIATGTKLEAAILAVMNCKKLGIKNIIAKAKTSTSREVIEAIGITRTISPEKESGIFLARQLVQHHIHDVINFDKENAIVEFTAPEKWHGKTLQELDLRQHYNINLIGFRETAEASLQVTLTGEFKISKDIILVAIAKTQQIEENAFLKRM